MTPMWGMDRGRPVCQAAGRMSARPRYAPYADGPGILRMGLHPLDPAGWTEPDANLLAELEEKDRLLRHRREDVFHALPDSLDAQAELLSLLGRHVLERFPDLYRRDGGTISIDGGATVDLSAAHEPPLLLASRLLQEDLCLLERSPAGYVLTAASLCAPSYWRLAGKIGKPLREIHGPVPGYRERLGPSVDRFFESLKADRGVWRCNWSVTNSPRLFQPSRDEPDPQASTNVTAANAGETLYVRVERQTLRRLPDSSSVVFTIKVYVDPVGCIRGDPKLASALAAGVEALTAEELHYKGMAELRAPLLAHLGRR
jgi:hypothetical protein